MNNLFGGFAPRRAAEKPGSPRFPRRWANSTSISPRRFEKVAALLRGPFLRGRRLLFSEGNGPICPRLRMGEDTLRMGQDLMVRRLAATGQKANDR